MEGSGYDKKPACLSSIFTFCCTFSYAGNVSSFQPEDRRDWVKNLLAAAQIQETEEEKQIKEAARYAAERWGSVGADAAAEDYQQDDLLERVPAPMLGTLDREKTMKRLDSSSALITVDGAESAISWRIRLMQLRALNSGAGNTSGKDGCVREFCSDHMTLCCGMVVPRFFCTGMLICTSLTIEFPLHWAVHCRQDRAPGG